MWHDAYSTGNVAKSGEERERGWNSVFLRYLLNGTRVDSRTIREHDTIDLLFKLVEGKPVGGRVTEGRIRVFDPFFAQDRDPGQDGRSSEDLICD